MRRTASVVIPVKDGARYLAEVLDATFRQARDAAGLEVLVVDSGSRDGSVGIARAAGAEVVEIPPESFGHGRTRNLAAERCSGELICFLTQDATPVEGWLRAYQEAFEADPQVGAGYGPHLPRPGTSPMIARELEEFFGTRSGAASPTPDGPGGPTYLSNVNACYRRECWEQIRFPDVPYSEDQAFGSVMAGAGWRRLYVPQAAVLHAHDYPPIAFMRRYFDEYRGLRQTIGHVEGFGLRSSVRKVRALTGADERWMREQGWSRSRRAGWIARSATHHTGRAAFSALGSRAGSLPAPVQKRISLEGTAVPKSTVAGSRGAEGLAAPPVPPSSASPESGRAIGALPTVQVAPSAGAGAHDSVLRVTRDGPAPLLPALENMGRDRPLHLAVLIPPFRRGSGGHNSIFQMLSRLERMGHTVSVWLHDPEGWQAAEWPAVVRRNISEYFAPFRGPVFKGFESWFGADVVVATGWQTVHPALTLDGCRARAYLVHDHESEFYATSAEGYWAEQTYSFGLHHIVASPWLADILRTRHGVESSSFDFGVDHDVYRPRPVVRRRDTVLFYARGSTPRRAVPLGLLALEELERRRPDVRIVFFGDSDPAPAPFAHEHLGIASPEQLAAAYCEATVGLCLSMTNYSLIPQEMLACGLPCVDLAGFSAESVFGADGPVELSPFDPVELADAIDRMLDDEALWQRRSEAGIAFVRGRTWDHAAEQVEAGLRRALRERELEYGSPELDDDGFVRHPAQMAPWMAPAPGWDASARSVPVVGPEATEATDRLYERLTGEDVSAVEAALDETTRPLWERAAGDEPHRRMLALAFGVWHRVPGVLERTGLRPDEPPEGVHAMARGPVAAGGSYFDADMVSEAAWRAGLPIEGIHSALDFGCSSGRVLRVLAAAWPQVEWLGVDPNADAIGWASEHVPEASFDVSPTDPPLPLETGSLDLAYAISIWSHFNEGAAVAWLGEMHRLVRPGGLLVFTVHGPQSVQLYAHEGVRPPRQLEQIRRALYRRGFWFAPEFGAGGDHGVSHPEWGTSFMTAEWLLRQVTPAWAVQDYRVGRNLGNQDVVVLRRRGA